MVLLSVERTNQPRRWNSDFSWTIKLQVTVSDCSGTADQQWTFTVRTFRSSSPNSLSTAQQNGQVQIYGNKCLDVINGVNADSTKVQIYTCEIPAAANQQWYYTGYGDNHLQWTNQSKCLDLTSGNFTNGNQVQVWTCSGIEVNQVWDTGYMYVLLLPFFTQRTGIDTHFARYNQLPTTSETGQSGTNACGTTSSQTSLCQTMYMNDADDFCLWAPASYSTIGNAERDVIAYCTKAGRGTRLIPDGTLQGVHFVRTVDYVQVTGVGNFTQINVDGSDGGGELDPHGADGNGNPIGGLVFGNTFGANLQYHEWTT